MPEPQATEPNPDAWIEWRPVHAPHVRGEYQLRTIDEETGLPDPQSFRVECEHVNDAGSRCGARWAGECTSGRVREKIQMFAARHLHRDPLQAPRVERPGSLRTKPEDE